MFQPKIKKMKKLPENLLNNYNYKEANHSPHVIPIDNANTRQSYLNAPGVANHFSR
jgi:hypothetical protein